MLGSESVIYVMASEVAREYLKNFGKRINRGINTISRWETATYHPSLEDLDQLARFFGVTILEFFPKVKHRQMNE